ncbi:dihydrolipoamide acetyltransferase family protein, partial [Actinomadura welshii]
MTPTAVERTFVLPDLGEGLTEAEVVRWLVAVGDEIAVDQSIAEVETAKAVVEVPSPYAGTVLTLHAAEGQTLDVGKPLITVGAAQDGTAQNEAAQGGAAHPDAERYREEEQAGSGNVLIGYGTSGNAGPGRRRRPRRAAPPGRPPGKPAAGGGPVLVISPLVRKLARDNGVDLTRVTASGPGGLITRGDVERAIGARSSSRPPAAAAPGERRIPLTGFRRAVSAALSRSRAEIPEATVWVDVDATALWALRESARTPADPGPGLLSYIARFVVAGLREYPVLNASVDTERNEIVEYDRINLGIAVQGDRGLVVPAVPDAGSLTTYQLDQAIRDVTRRARDGRVSAEELAAGTFTLNNYGGFRVDGSAAIINHPQVAILGFGRIIDRPWVVDGEIVPRKITQMSFVFDHRVCDGGTAAGFMRSVA